MSRLQKKAIKMVIWMYLAVLVLGAFSSYLIILRPLKSEAVQRYKNQNEYMLEEMDSSLKIIEEYANYIAYSKDVQQEVKRYEEAPANGDLRYELSSTLNALCYVKSGVRGIAVHSSSIPPAYSLVPPSDEEKELLSGEWYQSIKERESGGGFSKGFYARRADGKMIKVLAYGKNFKNYELDFTVVIFLDYTELFGKIERFRSREFEKTYWMTPQKELLFGEDTQGEELRLQELVNTGKEYIDTSRGVYFVSRLYQYPYISIAFISDNTLYHVFSEYIRMILIFLGAFFAASLAGILLMIRKITRPVFTLSQVMGEAVRQDLNVRLTIDSDDEIGDLSKIFNQMIVDLKNYVGKLVEKEKQEQEMRFGLLASQVDPHFVCNTLNTVNYLAKQKRDEDVVIVSTALSNILRDRLRLKDFQIYDTVRQEVFTVRHYLQIQEYRYGSKVKVHWEVSENVMGCEVPKNLIQPLIENSLFHGLADEDTGEIAGNIFVSIREDDNKTVVEVRDDGRGMSSEKAKRLERGMENTSAKGRGIGLSGIRERLGLLYGENYQLYIDSGEGLGTSVIIKMDRLV